MSDTKNKIQIKALELFNSIGIAEVSLRDIADELGISVGNLQYHFKKREDIVEALYFQIVEKIDTITAIKDDNVMFSFLHLSKQMISVLYEYRFFLLDFITITRRNQKIKDHYSKLSKQREMQFLGIADILICKGLLRKEVLENEYQNLYKRTEVISNFWFSSKLIQSDVIAEESIEEFSTVVNQTLYPYLTKEGKRMYSEFFPLQTI